MSKVSVVIPCYNRAQYIRQTLENVLGQSRPPDEVIVVDDGSTDESAQIVSGFGQRLRLFQQKNQGPGAARNRGLEESSGDYVWFMDSDDLASPCHLAHKLSALEFTGADIAYGSWIRSRFVGGGIEFLGPVLQTKPLPKRGSMLEWQLGSWCTIFQACLFRRSALDRAGYYETDMKIFEDGEYLVRILASGAKPIFCAGGLLFYRWDGDDQLTRSQDAAKQNSADKTLYYERIGDTLDSNSIKISRKAQRDLALQVFRHNQFCRKNRLPTVNPNNHVMKSVKKEGDTFNKLNDFKDRLQRRIYRLSSNQPTSKAMNRKNPGLFERRLSSETWQLANKIIVDY